MSRRDYAPWMRRVVRVLGVMGAVFAVLCVRAVTASKDELDQGELLESRGEVDVAAVHYRRSAGWYVPGNPYASEALSRLARLGEEAQAEGDIHRQLLAWRSVRSAILSTRSFYTPRRELLDEANSQIADAMASLDPPPIDRGKGRERVRAEHLELLEQTTRPSIGWTFVLLLGFGAWVTGVWMFVVRAVDTNDRFVAPAARLWGTVVVLGLGLFVLGMALA